MKERWRRTPRSCLFLLPVKDDEAKVSRAVVPLVSSSVGRVSMGASSGVLPHANKPPGARCEHVTKRCR